LLTDDYVTKLTIDGVKGGPSASTSIAVSMASSCAVSRGEFFFESPVAQFGCHDDAGVDLLFPD